jgi:hypothetical protein
VKVWYDHQINFKSYILACITKLLSTEFIKFLLFFISPYYRIRDVKQINVLSSLLVLYHYEKAQDYFISHLEKLLILVCYLSGIERDIIYTSIP